MGCKVCHGGLQESGAAQATGVCDSCRAKLGIVPMAPSTRLPKPCRHCQSSVFIRVVPRELSASGSGRTGDDVTMEAAPMTATTIPTQSSFLIFGRQVDPASVHSGAGKLEMYICRACGHVEWHCIDPENIPLGTEYMTQLVDFAIGSPYR